MSKISRKPGLSIRRLARSRSIVSTVSFATAAFLVVVAPVIFVALGQSYVAIALAVVVFNAAVWLVCFGFLSRQKARRADQGAIGEERLGLALEPLVSEGWAIEYNLKLRWGDADVYLASPSGKHYVIDAKSHRGGIIFFDPSSEMLMRRYESEIETVTYDLARDSYGKPKDLLKCVKGQALELARNNRLRWVTPIICFTGDIELDTTIPFLQPLQGVYVSRLGRILDLLNRLENGNILSTARHKPSITVPSPPTADNGWVNTLDSQKPEVLSKARSIISSNIYCNLSTATPDGYPWGLPCSLRMTTRTIAFIGVPPSQHGTLKIYTTIRDGLLSLSMIRLLQQAPAKGCILQGLRQKKPNLSVSVGHSSCLLSALI